MRLDAIVMKYKAAIFDMDGTLTDTLEDICDGVNEMLAHYNLPARSLEEVKNFVGNGARKLVERSLPKDCDEKFIAEALDYYNQSYARHMLNKVKPYAGIMDFLTALENKKIPLAICTNKQHFAAVEIAEKILSPIKFAEVVGDIPGQPRKPDPTRALEIAKKISVQPAEVAYFGDTAIDMMTAHNAGFFSVGVTWGFRPESELIESGAELIVHRAEDILKKIQFDI